MSVFFYSEGKIFHLTNSRISYIFRISDHGRIQNLYFGEAILPERDLDETDFSESDRQFIPEESNISLFRILDEDKNDQSFRYIGHSVNAEQLPSAFENGEDDLVESLNIIFHSKETETDLISTYSIIGDYPIITRRASVVQSGDFTIMVEKDKNEIQSYDEILTIDGIGNHIPFSPNQGESYDSPDVVMCYHPA